MTRIWGSSPVSENALHVQMAALRRVVGSHLIATKIRRGLPVRRPDQGFGAAGPAGAGNQGSRRQDPPRPRHACAERRTPPCSGATRSCATWRTRWRARVSLRSPDQAASARPAWPARWRSRRAAIFPDGVWFAELAPQRDLAGVIGTLHAALNVQSVLPRHPLEICRRICNRNVRCWCWIIASTCCTRRAILQPPCMPARPNLSIVATSRQALGCAASM